MRIFILDNYDSFTYNLVHYCQELTDKVRVVQNDTVLPGDAADFDKIILSPGPGLPRTSGRLMDFIAEYADSKPILGVCLGLQALTQHYGGKLRNLDHVLHGVATKCSVVYDDVLFPFAEREFEAGHYHSWVADENTLPPCLQVTSVNTSGLIMSWKHRIKDVRAVQFHPESILTPQGKQMLTAWLTNP